MSKYLLAQDGSDFSKKAAEIALGYAKDLGMGIDVIVVASTNGIPTAWKDDNLPQLIKEARLEEAKKIADDAKKYFKDNGVDVEVVIKEGNPAAEICTMGRSSDDYKMVIVGACGLSGIKRSILGSVANEVVQCAIKPVLVVK